MCWGTGGATPQGTEPGHDGHRQVKVLVRVSGDFSDHGPPGKMGETTGAQLPILANALDAAFLDPDLGGTSIIGVVVLGVGTQVRKPEPTGDQRCCQDDCDRDAYDESTHGDFLVDG